MTRAGPRVRRWSHEHGRAVDGESSPFAEPPSAPGTSTALETQAELLCASGCRTRRDPHFAHRPREPPDRNARGEDSLRRGEPVRLFTDELRCPVAVEDLAAQLWEVAQLPAEGARRRVHLPARRL